MRAVHACLQSRTFRQSVLDELEPRRGDTLDVRGHLRKLNRGVVTLWAGPAVGAGAGMAGPLRTTDAPSKYVAVSDYE